VGVDWAKRPNHMWPVCLPYPTSASVYHQCRGHTNFGTERKLSPNKPYDQESWAVYEERPPPPPTLITPLPQILHIGETGCLVSFAQIVLSDRNQTIHNGSPTVGLPPVPEGVASCHDGTAYLETRAVHSNTQDLTITIKVISNHGASPRHPEFGWLQRPHGHGLP